MQMNNRMSEADRSIKGRKQDAFDCFLDDDYDD